MHICLHHNDPDGYVSAAIVKLAMPETEFIEIDYHRINFERVREVDKDVYLYRVVEEKKGTRYA